MAAEAFAGRAEESCGRDQVLAIRTWRRAAGRRSTTILLLGVMKELELSRFRGRVNTEVFTTSLARGRGKLPP